MTNEELRLAIDRAYQMSSESAPSGGMYYNESNDSRKALYEIAKVHYQELLAVQLSRAKQEYPALPDELTM